MMNIRASACLFLINDIFLFPCELNNIYRIKKTHKNVNINENEAV